MSYQNQNYGYNGYGQAGYNSQDEQQNTSTSTSGTPLGWDDEVEEKSFILLPEGEYPFRVESFDREPFNGSEKMPPCNAANLHIVVNYNGEDVHIDKKLFLVSTNGQLFAFFRSIGAQVLPNGRIKMDWSKVPGATGRLLISHRKYNGNDYNNIKRFLPQGQSAQSAQPQSTGYAPGKW